MFELFGAFFAGCLFIAFLYGLYLILETLALMLPDTWRIVIALAIFCSFAVYCLYRFAISVLPHL